MGGPLLSVAGLVAPAAVVVWLLRHRPKLPADVRRRPLWPQDVQAPTKLVRRMRVFTASMVFTVVWALWHLPLFFIDGYYHNEVVEQGFGSLR